MKKVARGRELGREGRRQQQEGGVREGQGSSVGAVYEEENVNVYEYFIAYSRAGDDC